VAWPHFHSKEEFQNSYYDEYHTDASHALWCKRWRQWASRPNDGLLMLYAQKHSVDDRPWAPSATSRPHARREHGYADYRPGFYYLAADGALIVAAPQGSRLPVRAAPHDAASERAALAATRPRRRGGVANKLEPNVEEGWNICWNYKAGQCEWRSS